MEQVREKNPDILVIGKYDGAHHKILHGCKTCNYEWMSTPNCIKAGRGCPKCGGSLKLTHEEYTERVKEINPKVEVLGTYINSFTSVLHGCKTCKHVWKAIPSDIKRGKGCPKCSTGKTEKSVVEYVEKLGYKVEPQKTFEGMKYRGLLKCDLYLPELNAIIEYDGEYHYQRHWGDKDDIGLKETQKRDSIKNQFAQDNNMPILRIPYWDKDRRFELVDEFIRKLSSEGEQLTSF
ncbi:hypothetical protein FK483_0089 [Listeria phage LP-018]|uniref:Treble clef zinc finger domain-containing protein n=2 Tax=Homburgvirus TaxID=1921125 RepID=A0A6C0R282_9CAUD|nr:hypothetical protein FK483_0089 [Listeria phage LP-018]